MREKIFFFLIILLLNLEKVEILGMDKLKIRYEKIFEIDNNNPNGLHLFSNNNFVYITKDSDVFFFNSIKKLAFFKYKLNNNDLSYHYSFFIINDIACIFDKNTIILIDNKGNFKVNNTLFKKINILETLENLTPISLDEIVFNYDNKIILYNLATDKNQWQKDFGFINRTLKRRFLVKESMLLNCDDFCVFAVSKNKGDMIWKKVINKKSIFDTYEKNIYQLQIKNEKMLILSQNSIYCLDLKTRKFIWKINKKYYGLIDDKIIVFGDSFIIESECASFDINNGKKIWQDSQSIYNAVSFRNYLIADNEVGKSFVIINMNDGDIVYNGSNDFITNNHNYEASLDNLYLISNSNLFKVILI